MKLDPNRSIGCRGYTVRTYYDEAIMVNADFVVYLSGRADVKDIAEVQKRLALFFCSGDIDIVKSADRPRCFYCASLNDNDAKQCSQCGALL